MTSTERTSLQAADMFAGLCQRIGPDQWAGPGLGGWSATPCERSLRSPRTSRSPSPSRFAATARASTSPSCARSPARTTVRSPTAVTRPNGTSVPIRSRRCGPPPWPLGTRSRRSGRGTDCSRTAWTWPPRRAGPSNHRPRWLSLRCGPPRLRPCAPATGSPRFASCWVVQEVSVVRCSADDACRPRAREVARRPVARPA